MKLRQHPKLAGLLCALAVLACAAAPAVFLAAMDAASLGRSEQVTDPYTAPTPKGEDYYILRQLAERRHQQENVYTTDLQKEERDLSLYVGAQNNLEQMTNGYTYRETVDAALQSLVDCGTIAPEWAAWAGDWSTTDTYTLYDSGTVYPLNNPYYTTFLQGQAHGSPLPWGALDGQPHRGGDPAVDQRPPRCGGGSLRDGNRRVGERLRRDRNGPARARRSGAAGLCGPGRAGNTGRLGRTPGFPLPQRPVQPQRRSPHHRVGQRIPVHRLERHVGYHQKSPLVPEFEFAALHGGGTARAGALSLLVQDKKGEFV